MLYVMTHIREDVLKNSNINHMDQVSNVIKTFFDESSEKELYETLDKF